MTISQMEFAITLEHPAMTESIRRAIKALRDGKPILLLDDSSRENEGDLIVAGEKITTATMNFLIKEGSGIVCLALHRELLDRLNIPLMSSYNNNAFNTAFTISIEAKNGVTTGVSAKDRTHTILTAMADDARAKDLARPGHVFPLAAKEGGVFERMGHTEGSIDLMKIAGLKHGAVLCELMNKDGTMTTGQDRMDFANEHNIPVVTVEEILIFRMQAENICSLNTKNINSKFGNLIWHNFTFFNNDTVDVFTADNFNAKETAHIYLCDEGNLKQRLLNQLLTNNNHDDPLYTAFTQVVNNPNSLAIMTTVVNKRNEAKGEAELMKNAEICQALAKLSIKDINLITINEKLAKIANENFFISTH